MHGRKEISRSEEAPARRPRKPWNLLPAHNDQPLLQYIAYRLEDSDSLLLKKSRRRLLLCTAATLIAVASISLTLLLLNRNLIPPDINWVDPATHTLLETFGSLIAILIGIILSWEYSTSGKRNVLFLVYAFFSIGILDFFHAFSNYCHNLFVWYHSTGALLGGCFFFGSMFVPCASEPCGDQLVWTRRFSIFSGIFVILLFAIVSHTFYLLVPDVLSTSLPHHTDVSMAKGRFSPFIYAVDHTACILYLAAGILFVRGFLRSNDVIYLVFGTSMLLFFVSELFFVFSNLWNPLWWYWHFIKAIVFSGLLLGLAYGFTKTFYQLYSSRMQLAKLLEKIETKNIEIEKAYVTLKETQRYLSESEKMASIGKMAAMMAHEIRNPLGAISNSVGVLKKYSLRPEESAELLGLVEDEMDRLSKLTDDFLSFAKPSHLRRNATDVNLLLAETLSLLNAGMATPAHVVFQTSFDPDIPLLMLDGNHMKQVFINILMNSLQAMPQGGAVTIATKYKKADEEVEVTFTDTGPGMAEDVLSQVFQPFYTTKDKGLGLGLNIVYKIVKEHGGYILLSSRKAEGTQVKLSVPAVPRSTVQGNTLDNVRTVPDAIATSD
jgi:signal transduction histidine kinase